MWDINTLLKPISPDQPSGHDIAFSRDFDAIAEARRFDDPSIDQGEWQTDIKESDWHEVITRTTALLETQSKDLRLAVWLTEASACKYGFAGLGQGFLLIAGLCDQYWDSLYPEAEHVDQEQRAGNLSWIAARAEQLVRSIPLTEGRNTAYSYTSITQARNRVQNKDRDNARPEAGLTIEAVDSAWRKSSYAFYQSLLADVLQCIDALTRLQIAVDARLGLDGPGFAALKQSLDDVMHLLKRFANDQGTAGSVRDVLAAEAVAPQSEMLPTAGPASSSQPGGIQSRAQALMQLRAVARYFRETEPHSPVAYLADKAANWGSLPLHEWLRTVIKDNAALSHVEELLGLDVNTSGDKA